MTHLHTINFLKNKILFLAAIGLSIFALFFVIGSTWIGFEMKNQCQFAQHQYGGECVDALISQLEDESQNNHARNDAVWALGQLGDERALPVLQSFYTGVIPEREPYDTVLSQYELKKAINLTSGGVVE